MELKVDELIGQRFGRWVVLERTEDKSKVSYYRCKCDCGNEKDVAKGSLIKGKSKSCGCLNKELLKERVIDITGNRYGKLVVIRFDHCGENGQRYWLCKCDCGNETVVDRNNLNDKRGTRSCGCLLNDQMEERFEDLTGQKFGRLLITEFEGRDKNGQQWWSYICDCGILGHLSRNSLLSAGTRSCGCLSVEINIARAEDLIGQKFGKLTVIAKAERRDPKVIRWLCKCDCGNEVEVDCGVLKSGGTRSCGCLYAEAAEARIVDLTGRVFGRLTVIEREYSSNGRIKWICKCECGIYTSVVASSLQEGNTRSCGCLSREVAAERCETHGLSHTRRYRILRGMVQRCYNPKGSSYENYGGRGITVCDEWREDFIVFYEWAEDNGYSPALSIDRIDVNGNYEPSNCRWASPKEQNRNTRRNVFIEALGEIKTLGEWEEITGVRGGTIRKRYKDGKREEELFKPINKSQHKLTGIKRLKRILYSAKARCYNSNHTSYKDYGGRGIEVCEEWINDVNSFCVWAIEAGYQDDLSLDRIDNNRGYSPDNCRWATVYEQAANKRGCIYLTYNGKTEIASEWARELEICVKTLLDRVKKGMSDDRIFHKGRLVGIRKR